ncbi:MAG: hypothetical protein ACOYMA_17520 [Bacteroidia bacterium]
MKKIWKSLSLVCIFSFLVTLSFCIPNSSAAIIEKWSFNSQTNTGLINSSNVFAGVDSYVAGMDGGSDYAYNVNSYDVAMVLDMTYSSNNTVDGGFTLSWWQKVTGGGARLHTYINSVHTTKMEYHYGLKYISCVSEDPVAESEAWYNMYDDWRNDTWQMWTIVGTPTSYKEYKNGTLIYTCSYSNDPFDSDFNSVNWGSNYNLGNDGTMWDNIIAFNEPLTEEQIDTLYSTGDVTSFNGFSYCGDNICNDEETWESCFNDCVGQSNGYNNIISKPADRYDPMLENSYEVFNYSYNTELISNTLYGGLAYIEIFKCNNIGCSNSTQIEFNNGLATSSKSYMFSGSGSIATSTSNYGSSQFVIMTPTDTIGTTTDTTITYKIIPYYFNSSNLETVTGNPIAYKVFYYAVNDNPYIEQEAATSSFVSLFGKTPHELACSNEEWQEATSTPWYSFNFFNFNTLKCNTFETVLTLAEFGINIPVAIINSGITVVKNTFPFGLITNVISQWNLAKNESLPADINWINPVNENNDLTIPIPANWSNSTTTQQMVIFGNSLFITGDGNVSNFFTGVRALSTYGLWIGFIWWILSIGNSIYNEIMAFTTVKKHEDTLWQY